jgi:urease beta subunit
VGRVLTEGLNETEAEAASLKGYKFNINTGDITLTNATETTVLYIKNTGNYPLVCKTFIHILGNTTGGSGDGKVDIIRNPTSGDIITNANDVLIGPGISANQNYGSRNTLSGNYFKGASGESVISASDGVHITTRLSSSVGRIPISLDGIILPINASVAVNYTPPTGNTSQIVQFACSAYIRHPEIVGEEV